MSVLLINPNRYKFPPVIPVGIEYISGSLVSQGIDFATLDLCFSDMPENELVETITSYHPDIAAISIRQTDTTLYHQNECFLPEIKKYTGICKSYGCIVVLGGSGFSIMPEKILEYAGADYGIHGPGEYAFVRLLNSIADGGSHQRILDGYPDFPADFRAPKREMVVDYAAYIQNEGIVGFRTQIGCDGKCMFCTESDKKVIFRDPDEVGQEIAMIKRLGYENFHLCDSEFNLSVEHCIDVCKAIKSISGPVNWALYMKPEPYNEDLFYWLRQSGANMLTLSLDTQDTSGHYLRMVGDFLFLANKYHLKVAIDLSTGFPFEDMANAQTMIDFLDRQPVHTVGVNFFYRVYPGTKLHQLIEHHSDLQQFLIKPSDDKDFLFPVFFNFFNIDKMKKITANRKKFRIEGFEKATNYQRLGR
jgi:hypothetical protein